jgi:hypothetical protein
MDVDNNEELSMAEQAALNKRNKAARASGERIEEPPTEELPEGAAPLEKPEIEASSENVADALGEGEEAPPVVEKEEEEPIRIAGKTFKTQKEAFAYAEQLEQNNLIAEAHAQGVREALAANAPPVVPPEEEDFDTKFYSNPKEALRDVQIRARDEAVALIRQETAREKAWNEFLSEYPDIRRQDAEAILGANTKTIVALPWEDGRKALARAVYKEYDEIDTLRRPKTELTNKKPALSPSGGVSRSVTPKASEEKSLSFMEQVRKVKSKG